MSVSLFCEKDYVSIITLYDKLIIIKTKKSLIFLIFRKIKELSLKL
jgi:hypothetical protein